ncbi:unnamed protein product, partial [Heterosigma akashiwo]
RLLFADLSSSLPPRGPYPRIPPALQSLPSTNPLSGPCKAHRRALSGGCGQRLPLPVPAADPSHAALRHQPKAGQPAQVPQGTRGPGRHGGPRRGR